MLLSSIIRAKTLFKVEVVQVAVKNMLVLRWSIMSFVTNPKGTLEPPKGIVPLEKA